MAREWDIKKTTFSVGDFISWNRAGELELSPSFQRRDVWTKPQKSYLIDTVFRGLPVPIIFLRERTDVETLSTVREVIDGQQRLRTLLAFTDLSSLKDKTERDEFKVLKKHNPEISDTNFDKLKAEKKTRIISYQFSVHVLPSDTSDADVLSIFARMNSTGSKLSDQELRNAEFFGSFKTVSYNLAFSQLERWRGWKIMSEQEIARMKEVELTSELLMLIMDGMFEQTQKNITGYYRKYDEEFPRQKEICDKFLRVMSEIEDSFGASIADSNFNSRNQFFQLFNLVMRLMDEGVPLTRARVRKVLETGDKIKNREGLPEKVLVALASRFNRLRNRNIVADYLYQNATV